jgi:AcrR family transcriptional regulator
MGASEATADVAAEWAEVRDLLTQGAPRPLLSQTAERRLGHRHREVLDQIEHLFLEHGFAEITIAQIAAGVGCSRRTIYEIAPSKEQLVLIVIDRSMHRLGRDALAAVDPGDPLIEQLRQYIEGGIDLHRRAGLFEDLADHAPARRLVDRHFRFVMTVVERLVSLGIERGEFVPVTPGVVAAVVAGSSAYLTQPELIEDVGVEFPALVSEMLDLTLAGLPKGTPP